MITSASRRIRTAKAEPSSIYGPNHRLQRTRSGGLRPPLVAVGPSRPHHREVTQVLGGGSNPNPIFPTLRGAARV
jgi:hypothetical protein